ncbi:hypothetical protein ACT691_01920 [Vibrio metschnikovii]
MLNSLPLEEAALLAFLISTRFRILILTLVMAHKRFGRSIYIEDPEGNVIELKAFQA